ncbi:MAG: M48 family metallopeptidase [Candidatus Calescibacterium sp.]|nr:M48 family metallopeptidase [Candidatus Calescibacterium sp.]MDW8132565.1 M48 family metallopeptidase [Candidatus Calescibacterium sp.]
MQLSTLPRTESGKLKFPGISLKAIQHKFDTQATEALKKIPLLPQLMKVISKIFTEEALYVFFTGQALRVTPNQYPRLYNVYREAIQILDLQYEPEFFLQTNEIPNAFAMGIERKFVIVTSGITDILNEEELLFVIGHELGHNKFDHMLTKTVAYVLGQIGVGVISALLGGVGQLAAISLQLGLLHWSRMAEFSADRAGFLVVQDREACLKALSKLAGYSRKYSEEGINIDEVLLQAKQLDETNLLQSFYKYVSMIQMTHPFIPYRVRELDEWIKSQEVANIFSGNYSTEEEYNRRFMGYQYPPYQQAYYPPQYPAYPPYPPYPYPQQPYVQSPYTPYQQSSQQYPSYFQGPYQSSYQSQQVAGQPQHQYYPPQQTIQQPYYQPQQGVGQPQQGAYSSNVDQSSSDQAAKE